jgi:hypothetical protein
VLRSHRRTTALQLLASWNDADQACNRWAAPKLETAAGAPLLVRVTSSRPSTSGLPSFDALDLKDAKALLGAGLTKLPQEPTALESSRTDYSLRLPLAGLRCRMPLPNTSCFLKERIVPGARPLALIRRRPAPVSA